LFAPSGGKIATNCLSPPHLRGRHKARPLKSCCSAYTGQRSDAIALIDVMVGSMTERSSKFGHDKLSVFGIGPASSMKNSGAPWCASWWRWTISDPTARLWGIEVTETARGRLEGRTEVWLREEPGHSRQPRDQRPTQDAAISVPRRPAAEPSIPPRTSRSGAGRSEIERKRGVPAYVVCRHTPRSTASASVSAQRRPRRASHISGIGDQKAFGTLRRRTIRAWLKAGRTEMRRARRRATRGDRRVEGREKKKTPSTMETEGSKSRNAGSPNHFSAGDEARPNFLSFDIRWSLDETSTSSRPLFFGTSAVAFRQRKNKGDIESCRPVTRDAKVHSRRTKERLNFLPATACGERATVGM